MKVLFIGDVYGDSGREYLYEHLPELKQHYKPNLIFVNGENLANGRGMTPKLYKEAMDQGIHAFTMGNHTFGNKAILEIIEDANIVRPLNIPKAPGKGYITINYNSKKLLLINVMGRVYMNNLMLDCPFKAVDSLLETEKADWIIVDMHAEATSEKIAFAHYFDGRVDAIVGTHTHVPTADYRKLPNNTLYITDLGMTGPLNGVIGVDASVVIDRFIQGYSESNRVATGLRQLNGVFMDLTLKSNPKIEPIRIIETQPL